MRSNLVSKGIRAAWNMKKILPLTLHLMRDGRVDRINKIAFLFVTIGYLIFPYDFIFDFPFLGQFDDLAVLLFMVNWFIKRAPKTVLEEYGWSADEDGEPQKKKRKLGLRKAAK